MQQKRKSRKHFRARLEEMVDKLRQDIVSGTVADGSFLPAESDLEERFELSNASVRKGLHVLVEEGLLEKIPRVGNRVTRPVPARKTVRFGYAGAISRIVRMDELLEVFHERYPHLQVQTVELPSRGYTGIIKEYMEAGLLDAALMNSSNFQDFRELGCTGLLHPLKPTESAYPFLTEPFCEERGALLRPFVYSPVILCYNKDHFRESGVPVPDSSWTWQELFEQGRRLAVPNERFGFYFYLPSRNRWPIFILQSGAAVRRDEAGCSRLDDPKLLEGLAACRDLVAMSDVFPRILSESDADAEALFLKGKVSMIMTTYFFLNQLRESGISFDVSPLPSLNDASTLLIVNGLVINERSPQREEAALLVDFLTSYEAQRHLRRRTLNIAAHRQAMEWEGEEEVYRPARFFMYREIFPTFRLMTELGFSNGQLKAIQREVMLYLSGLQDQEAFIQAAHMQLNLASAAEAQEDAFSSLEQEKSQSGRSLPPAAED